MALELLVGAVGLVIGFALGYLYAKNQLRKSIDISEKSALLQSLATQVTEMKAKFDAYEKLREQKEKDSEKLIEQKEKRYAEFMESTKKFFENQDKIRMGFEEKRDKQMSTFSSVIDAFNRTIHGTKTRGAAGEEILRRYLRESIKAKIIKSPLKMESGEVEFAWNLGDGRYVPIDSKLPELGEILEMTEKDKSQESEKKLRRQVIDKIKLEIDNVKKYQNQPNTINKCILAIPKDAIDAAPEIIELGATTGVIVCSYEHVLLVGYMLAEEYDKNKEEGDVGELKQFNKRLLGLLKEIATVTDTIERQTKSVLKHNEEIRDKVQSGLRL